MVKREQVESRFMTTKELREMLRVSEAQLPRMRATTDFPRPIVIGPKKILYVRREVEAWLETRRMPA